MTRVAFIVLDDFSVPNGTTVRIHRVLSLINKKYDISVINCKYSDQGRLTDIGLENVHLINVRGIGWKILTSSSVPAPFKLLPVLLWNLRLALILLRNRFDVVYCANDKFGFLSVYLVSKIRRFKTIFEAHAIYSKESEERKPTGARMKFDRSLERFVIRHADHIIALSPNTFGFYRSYNERIDLVPVFVDSDLYTSKDRPKRADSKLVGLIGPFDTGARQRHYLDFLYIKIDSFDRRIRFLVIGRCEKRIEDNRITYTGYLDSINDYIFQLSHLDTVLIPEELATLGPLNKIIEPMSCSLPVFTTPQGMVGLYWVEPGKDILVFEEEEMVDKVNKLIFDERLMEEIGRNARRVVEQYYSKKANEEKLVKILESLAGG